MIASKRAYECAKACEWNKAGGSRQRTAVTERFPFVLVGKGGEARFTACFLYATFAYERLRVGIRERLSRFGVYLLYAVGLGRAVCHEAAR